MDPGQPVYLRQRRPRAKDRDKQARLFQEKAEELGELQARDLRSWYVGEYGPSGAGAMPLTNRQQWILAQFEFLRSHMVAIPVRTCSLKFDLPAAATADEEKTQTCGQPVTTPEADSDASAAAARGASRLIGRG